MLTLVKKYLKKCNYLNSVSEFEDNYMSHPNFPSLYAITDTLNLLNVENIAIKVPKNQFEQLPSSFLTFYKNEFVLLVKKDKSINIESEKGKKTNLTSYEFLKEWGEIVLAIEPSINKNFTSKINQKWLLNLLPFTLIIFLSFSFFRYNFLTIAYLLSTLIGLYVSIKIIQTKLGFSDQISSTICELGKNNSCSSVIQSEEGRLFSGLSFSDLPILYFSINFLTIIFNPTFAISIIPIVSILSIPILMYSIWIQKSKLKKWCFLCLVILSLIVIQSFGIVTIDNAYKSINYKNTIFLLNVSAIVFIIWHLLGKFIENSIFNEKELLELKRFKRNFKVFNSILNKSEILLDIDKLHGIEFGNPDAKLKISLFLSPSCGHCHKAFKDALELVNKFSSKVFLNIVFNINPENSDNPYKKVVETLLSLNGNNPEQARNALIDWHIHKLELDNWTKKWNVYDFYMLANNEMHKQYEFCLQNNFNYTPVRIVNNKILPLEYNLDELQFFINDFETYTIAINQSDIAV